MLLIFIVKTILNNDTATARSAGLKYAIHQCNERKKPKGVCDNLQVELDPPNGKGRQYYIVYAYYRDTTQFNASMDVSISKLNKTTVTNFMLVSN